MSRSLTLILVARPDEHECGWSRAFPTSRDRTNSLPEQDLSQLQDSSQLPIE